MFFRQIREFNGQFRQDFPNISRAIDGLSYDALEIVLLNLCRGNGIWNLEFPRNKANTLVSMARICQLGIALCKDVNVVGLARDVYAELFPGEPTNPAPRG